MDRFCESLIIWVNTFEGVTGARDSVAALSDGVALAQILHVLIPAFDPSDIRTDVADKPRLKVINLKKLKRALIDFYGDEVQVAESDLVLPDEAKVEQGDEKELVKLLELLLGCAVQCANKETFISQILSLEETVKADLMASIQRLMSLAHNRGAGAASPQHSSGASSKELEDMKHRFSKLKQEYDQLLEQYNSAESEIDSFKAREIERGKQSAAAEAKQVADVLAKAHRLETELEEVNGLLDNERQEHVGTRRQFERALAEMKRQLEKALDEASDVQRMRDEMEELRGVADTVPSLEKRIASYQKKLEEFGEVQTENSRLIEQTNTQLKRILELEETTRTIPSLNTNLLKYKETVARLEEELLDEKKKNDKERFENKRLKDSLAALEKENRTLAAQKKALEEHDDSSLQSASSSSQYAEAQAKIVRLEHEVQVLKAQCSGNADEQLKDLLEDAQRRKERLEAESREQAVRIMELESALDDAKRSSSMKTTGEVAFEQLASSEKMLRQQNERVASLEVTETRLKEELAKMQNEVIELKKQVSLVGLDQKEMIEKAQSDAQALVEAKLAELNAASAELRALKLEYASVVAERDSLRTECQQKTEHLARVLTEKDDLNTKCLQMAKENSDKFMEMDKTTKETVAKDTKIQNLEGLLIKAKQKIQAQKENIEKLQAAAQPAADANFSEALAALRAQLEEEKKQHEFEKRQREKIQTQFEREEKLIISAWYDMALQNQRLAVQEREKAQGGSSFLAKQRQAVLKRNTME